MFMKESSIQEIIGNTDIYLIDQILKQRYQKEEIILDAGCGSGRNLHYFYENGYTFFAVDSNVEILEEVKRKYPRFANNCSVSTIETLSFAAATFDHVICSAVLHFATSEVHFKEMFAELVRVLKKGGSLFIRMTSTIGLQNLGTHLQNGVYALLDGTQRFLLTRELLNEMMTTHQLSFVEPVKSTNVNDLRSMTTLVLLK